MMSAIESNVMVNPLNDMNNVKRVETENRVQQQRTQVTASDDLPADDANHVSISSTSKHLSALKEVILKAPEVNHTRIKFLKEELASGRYRILSDQIAAKMLDDIELA
ncbi:MULTISPECIES: flagellar biosynthesis anti-sigma factor FlgM [Legionella]|uniref:Negative regulator of flagellin synthesis n=1 Tax=Legionella drozanskii LLAP-1 TaxID=1212489 RepID=A0A0W0TCW6_9GAMM|nr:MULTISPECIES: flagellar biosynthesis anti-sigma factor FlgM [Legionella]KTC93093.1 flagellin synthesis negative regulator [Legionella drozanskii LLAP-1]PJE11994.1 MAG: flagellar biosynthesis anti-sigma factor FlgM [Legionella sp.]